DVTYRGCATARRPARDCSETCGSPWFSPQRRARSADWTAYAIYGLRNPPASIEMCPASQFRVAASAGIVSRVNDAGQTEQACQSQVIHSNNTYSLLRSRKWCGVHHALGLAKDAPPRRAVQRSAPSSHQSCADCIIATHGYDFWEGHPKVTSH